MKTIIVLFFMLAGALNGHAAVDESFYSPLLQASSNEPNISSYFNDNVRKFRCDFSKQMIKELDSTNDLEIETKISAEITNLERVFKGNKKQFNRSEKKLFKAQLRALKKLLKKKNTKNRAKNFYRGLCKTSENITWKGFRALAHGANAVLLGATFPFRFIWEVGRGAIQGTRICLVPENDKEDAKLIEKPCESLKKHQKLYDQIGKPLHGAIAVLVLWQAVDGFFKAFNLSLLPIVALPLIDHQAQAICRKLNTSNPEEVKFCDNYDQVKKTFFKGVKYGNKLGRKINKKKTLQKDFSMMPELEETTNENICEQFKEIKNYTSPYSKGKQRKELIQAVLNPGYFATPKRFDFDTSEEKLKKIDFYERIKLKNIIITLGPSEFHQERLKEVDQDELESRIKEFKALNKIKGKMHKANTVSKCKKVQKTKKFDWIKFSELRDSITKDKQNEFKAQDKIVHKQIKQARGKFRLTKKLKLNWEVIKVNTIKSLFEVLKRDDVGNVFIAVHSNEQFKKLVDSDLNLVPSTFFSQISPTIMSLTFYSCHSLNIMKTYNLEKKFTSMNTIHKLKHLFFVNENEYLGEKSYAPITGLKSYLLKVDKYLYNSLRGNNLYSGIHQFDLKELPSEKICELDIGSDLRVIKGGMSVDLNRQLIGSFNFYDEIKQISFPCRLFNQEKNKIVLNGIISGTGDKLEINDVNKIRFSLDSKGENLTGGKDKIKYSSEEKKFIRYTKEYNRIKD